MSIEEAKIQPDINHKISTIIKDYYADNVEHLENYDHNEILSDYPLSTLTAVIRFSTSDGSIKNLDEALATVNDQYLKYRTYMGYILFLAYVRNNFKMEANKDIKEKAETHSDHEDLDKVHTYETYESLKITAQNDITKLTDAMEKVVKNIDETDNFIHFLHHNSWGETFQDIVILLLRVLTYATVLPILCIIVVNKLSGEDVNWKVFTTNSEVKKTIKSITLESSAKCLGFENIKDWKTLIMDKSKQEPAKVQRLNIG
jgi:hypothetical protein